LLDTDLLGPFGDALADQLGGFHIATILDLRAHFLFQTGSGGQHTRPVASMSCA
jgi:hypothetical protein